SAESGRALQARSGQGGRLGRGRGSRPASWLSGEGRWHGRREGGPDPAQRLPRRSARADQSGNAGLTRGDAGRVGRGGRGGRAGGHVGRKERSGATPS